MFPRYEAVSAHKKTLEPQGCHVVEGDAICPLQQMVEKTFERTLEANMDMRSRILDLQEKNGGELPIIFYVNVGTGQVFLEGHNSFNQISPLIYVNQTNFYNMIWCITISVKLFNFRPNG